MPDISVCSLCGRYIPETWNVFYLPLRDLIYCKTVNMTAVLFFLQAEELILIEHYSRTSGRFLKQESTPY